MTGSVTLIFLLLLHTSSIVAFVWNHQSLVRGYYSLSSSSSLASSSSSASADLLLSKVKGKTLVSVPEILEIFNAFNDSSITNQVKFIDASWWHKGPQDAGRHLFEKGPRIPNSIYFDIDDICLPSELNPKNLPHMIPPSILFSTIMDHFQISKDDHIFIYARDGVIFTPRTWFIFRAFGHDPTKIHLMQGSLEEWMDLDGPVENDFQQVPRAKDIMEQVPKENGSYVPKYQALPSPKNVCDLQYMLRVVEKNDIHPSSNDEQSILIDSRGSSFHKSGHMPGAIHIPYSSYTRSDNALKFKSIQELKQVFQNVGIDPLTNQQIIATCGSGVSVCHTLLALELCGRNLDHDFMYDGSWAEWSMEECTPKVCNTT